MNYLDQAKNKDAEKASRMQTPASDESEVIGDFTILGPSVQDEPKTVTAPVAPREPEKKTPKPLKEEKSDTKRKKPAKEESEDFADKDKYSIYLPPKLSMALRMVYISTRKKYSHITEIALTDMLFNRYQCHNPKCTARFSISEGDHTPICCPVCGEKKFSPLRMDLFD